MKAGFIGEANLLECMLVAVDGQRAIAELVDRLPVTGTLPCRENGGGESVTWRIGWLAEDMVAV